MTSSDWAKFGAKYTRQIQAASKPSKFGAETALRTLADGGQYKFASKAEARRYDELLLMQRADKIRKLKIQPQFTVQESYIDGTTGERVKAIHYVADFSYERKTAPDVNGTVYWLPVVEDVKGFKTEAYKLKRKLVQERFGISITEVNA